jgi:hypothetical protein
MLCILSADFNHILNLKTIRSVRTAIESSPQPSATDIVEVASWNYGLLVGGSLQLGWFGFDEAEDELGE